MKAKDLIEKLQEVHPEAEVFVGCAENDAYGYDIYFHLEVHDRDQNELSSVFIVVDPYHYETDTVWK